ncbi:MAG: recombination-associated protein RdgC [Desulfobulbia bacterium]
MGFVSGSASFIRFGIEGELPSNMMEFIADRIASFSFRDIDDTMDEYSIGWVSVANMFDAGFRYASFMNGDYVTISLRVDERKVSPAILKKFVQKEEERIKVEKQIPKIGRTLKAEIKERVHAELIRKAIPIPAVFDLCWNLSESTVLFFTTNKKIHAVLEDFFKDCFGLLLVQQIPYVTAEHLLDDEQTERLASINPEIFV